MDDAIGLKPTTFMDIMGPSAKNTKARRTPEKSSTLMRSAVNRPTFGVNEAENEQSAEQSSFSTFHSADLSGAAALTRRSPLISRYTPNTQNLQDMAADFEAPEPAQDVQPEPIGYESDAEPMSVALEQPSFNIFKGVVPSDLAYNHASQPRDSRLGILKRLSGWSVLAIVIVGVVGGGIFINRNLTRVELYMASSRAGFSATLPKDSPAGYDLSGIATGSGSIEASYNSNTDNRTYSIGEKQSSGSAQLAAFVESKAGVNYQTINTAGKTIYVYNGHDATWTNNGVWYIVQDNNSLSDHQIINLADSM